MPILVVTDTQEEGRKQEVSATRTRGISKGEETDKTAGQDSQGSKGNREHGKLNEEHE